MGAGASMNPAVFALAKEEYEVKKNELNDEDLFNYMKAFIETKTIELETQAAQGEQQAEEAPAESHEPPAEEAAPPAEEAPAEA